MKKVKSLKEKVEQGLLKVLAGLGVPHDYRISQPMVDKVILVHYAFHEESKYSRIEKLIPLIIYVFLTLHDFRVNKSDLIQVSEIFYEEFNCFFYQLKNYISNYYQSDNYV